MTPETVNKAPSIEIAENFSFRKNIEIGRANNGDIDPNTDATEAPIILTANV